MCVCVRERENEKKQTMRWSGGTTQWVLQLGTKVQVTVGKMMYVQQSFIRFCSLCWGVPPEVVSVHQQGRWPILGTSNVLLHLFGLHTHHILPLPVLDHVEGLKRANNVFLCEGRHFTEGEGGREGERIGS